MNQLWGRANSNIYVLTIIKWVLLLKQLSTSVVESCVHVVESKAVSDSVALGFAAEKTKFKNNRIKLFNEMLMLLLVSSVPCCFVFCFGAAGTCAVPVEHRHQNRTTKHARKLKHQIT